jgi:hypothetical protein
MHWGISIEEAEKPFYEQSGRLCWPVTKYMSGVRKGWMEPTDSSTAIILEGMDVSVLEATVLSATPNRRWLTKVKELGKISGLIDFHCILRFLELEQKGKMVITAMIFKDIPAIGFHLWRRICRAH